MEGHHIIAGSENAAANLRVCFASGKCCRKAATASHRLRMSLSSVCSADTSRPFCDVLIALILILGTFESTSAAQDQFVEGNLVAHPPSNDTRNDTVISTVQGPRTNATTGSSARTSDTFVIAIGMR